MADLVTVTSCSRCWEYKVHRHNINHILNIRQHVWSGLPQKRFQFWCKCNVSVRDIGNHQYKLKHLVNNVYDLMYCVLCTRLEDSPGPTHNYVNGKIAHPSLSLLYPDVYFVNPSQQLDRLLSSNFHLKLIRWRDREEENTPSNTFTDAVSF